MCGSPELLHALLLKVLVYRGSAHDNVYPLNWQIWGFSEYNLKISFDFRSGAVFHDWKKAQNCVAKLYKQPAKKRVYFGDVLVQMDAKFLGEQYNKTQPPKKVKQLNTCYMIAQWSTCNPLAGLSM
jgi:hypothetical protein